MRVYICKICDQSMPERGSKLTDNYFASDLPKSPNDFGGIVIYRCHISCAEKLDIKPC